MRNYGIDIRYQCHKYFEKNKENKCKKGFYAKFIKNSVLIKIYEDKNSNCNHFFK